MTEQLARTRHLVATTAEWAAVNPFIVAAGEIAIEIKTDQSRWMKIGDGTTSFANLEYAFDYSINPIFDDVIITGTLDVDQVSADLLGSLYIRVKNTDTESLAKGTPFYISGTATEAGVVEIKKAIASDNAKGPAMGLVAESIAINAEGKGVLSGQISDYNTVFPGWTANQPLYVGQSGGLTGTAPAGYKQIVARVGRINGSTGTIIIERGATTSQTTDSITEGSTNLYFTQARARNAISASGLIGYDPLTGAITYTGATPLTSAPPTDLSYTASTRLLASSTGTDATLPLFSSTLAGLAPSSGGGTTNFLRADGTWAAPVGGGAAGVTDFSGGTTGLSPSVATTGSVTLSGTLGVANGGTGVTAGTGTGSNVLNNGPTLIAPLLGTPASGNLVNCTGYTFANIASKPTTLAGYGITDAAGSFSAGTTGLTPSTPTSGNIVLGGTLAVANGGTGATTSTGSGSVVLSSSPTLVTPYLGTPYSGNLINCTGYTFTNIASKPTTLAGYGITDGVSLSAANAFTGANTFTNSTGQTFRQAATQDGILVRGRAGGNASYTIEIAPATLTASRTLTLPNVTGTFITSGDSGTVTDSMLAGSISDSKLLSITSVGKVSGTAITYGNITTSGNIATSGSVAVGQSSAATNTDLDVNGTYAQTIVAVPSLNIDCSTGNYFTKTISSSVTFTVSNVPSNRAYAFTLEVTHTNGSITWFSGVGWPSGVAPTLTAGKTHLFTFVTQNGGTRWRGSSQVNYTN